MIPRPVSIRYTRPPGRVQIFNQALLHDGGDYLVTFVPATDLSAPVTADEETILEPGSPVVWFTYPDRWYDIGSFHLADGTFTGFYANILTPVRFEGDLWHTTDLFIDVFSSPDGRIKLLDEEELTEAEEARWIDRATATQARAQAALILAAAQAGSWPPPHVKEWTLQRAREEVGRVL